MKKVKKVGISCGSSSGARFDRLPVMQCDSPYEEFGDKVNLIYYMNILLIIIYYNNDIIILILSLCTVAIWNVKEHIPKQHVTSNVPKANWQMSAK